MQINNPGTYNARKSSLEGFWKSCFGYTHGVMLVEVFYENVKKAKMEGTVLETHDKDENVVLEFRPSNGQLMHVACLWSRWTKTGEPDLLSFAAITDEPPPEIEVAGHDRCHIVETGNDSYRFRNSTTQPKKERKKTQTPIE